jgi:hypothetical protein
LGKQVAGAKLPTSITGTDPVMVHKRKSISVRKWNEKLGQEMFWARASADLDLEQVMDFI